MIFFAKKFSKFYFRCKTTVILIQRNDGCSLAEKGRLSPQKHSRPARLERFALLLVSSPHRLASSAAGSASAVRPTPVPVAFVRVSVKKENQCIKHWFSFWRRRGDSNSRAGYPTYALSRGASSPT